MPPPPDPTWVRAEADRWAHRLLATASDPETLLRARSALLAVRAAVESSVREGPAAPAAAARQRAAEQAVAEAAQAALGAFLRALEGEPSVPGPRAPSELREVPVERASAQGPRRRRSTSR